MYAIMGVALPAMGRELDASAVELGLGETIFLATAAALLLPIGRFADATDKITLFKVGLVALAAVTFTIGLQPSMTSIIGFRFLQGMAAALISATSMAIIADIAPRNRLGRMLGLAIGATYVGLASGPFFSGLVTTHLGWRWVFFLAAVPPLVAYLLSRATIESRWRAPTASINLPNSMLLMLAIMLFIAGAAMLGRTGYGYAFIGLGLALGVVYLVSERRTPNPLVKIDEVRANHRLSRALTVQFLIYCSTIGTSFLLSIYLQVIRGYTPEAAGHILVLGPIVMASVSPIAGRFADRIPPRRIYTLGAGLILCSATLAAFVTAQSGLTLVAAIMVTQGLGFALFSAPNIAVIMTSVGPEERGVTSALSAVMRSMGMMVSMFIVTALLSLRLGAHAVADRPEAFLSVMTWSFTVFAALTALGVILAARSPETGHPPT